MIKLSYDLWSELKVKKYNKASAIRFIDKSKIFLIQKNDFLGNLARVSIFYLDEDSEVEIGKGYVYNIQDKFIQVKLLSLDDHFKRNYSNIMRSIENNDNNVIQKIIVKSYITYSIH